MSKIERENDSKTKFVVDLEPIGRRVEVDASTDLLSAAQKAGVDLVAVCGGMGLCGTCMVRLLQGELSPLTSVEERFLDKEQIKHGYRLACQANLLSNVRIEITPDALPVSQRIQIDGPEFFVEIDPNVISVDLVVPPPELNDLRADLSRINQKLITTGHAPLQGNPIVLGQLARRLRQDNWSVRLAIHQEPEYSHLAATLPKASALLGLAVDLGTTKMAVYLVNLMTGATLAKTGVMNPQIAYGEDVISRIAFANHGAENLELLQSRVVDTLNQVVEDLCEEAGVSKSHIVDAVLVGNTAMHHFLCGLPVEQLGTAPYVPVVSDSMDFPATDIGLDIAAGAWCYLPANIAGFVGGDHTSGLLTIYDYTDNKTLVFIDVGTNTEVSLIHRQQIYSCSTASGPAFEGAHIKDGMSAAPGAIEKVSISATGIELKVIGNRPPIGICGTGILSAISEMLSTGLLDARGALMEQNSWVHSSNRRNEFVLVPGGKSGHGRDIVITREDVQEIQLAKAAIRAGIDIVLEEAGIQAETVDEWIIAGAFGTYLDLESTLRLGMFPTVPLDRFLQVGNSAGMGAKQMLLSRRKRQEARQIAQQVTYLELTTHSGFTQKFIDAMYF